MSEGVDVVRISAADDEVGVPDVGNVASSVDLVEVRLRWSKDPLGGLMGAVVSDMVVVVKVVKPDKHTAAVAY